MVKTLLSAVLALGLAGTSTGCIVRTQDPPRRVYKQSRCHPSQYWDGYHCRDRDRHRHHRRHR